MREIETAGPNPAAPASEPLEEWQVAAIGPDWAPAPGEAELRPVEGSLSLHREGLFFRAEDAVARGSGEPVSALIPAESVIDAGPLSAGSRVTQSELAGLWMPRPLRRFRTPGFSVRTREGAWVFDCPHGQSRAREVTRRYAAG